MKLKSLTILFIILILSSTGNAGFVNINAVENNPIELKIRTKSPENETAKSGEIEVKISGGTAPYEVRCMGPEFNYKIKDNSDLKLKNLIKGAYLIIVRDQEGQLMHKEIQL